MKTTTTWTGKMGFLGKNPSGHEVKMDGPATIGGEDSGSRPTELLLQAVAGCTAIDIISILRKMRIEPERFETEVEGTRAEEHPKKFTHIHIHYILDGDIPEKKLARAIKLSKDEYCSVSHTLNADITASYTLNGEKGEMDV